MANLGVAIAAGAININRIRRGPNCVREDAVLSENIYDSLRLHPHQITTLAWEYTQLFRTYLKSGRAGPPFRQYKV